MPDSDGCNVTPPGNTYNPDTSSFDVFWKRRVGLWASVSGIDRTDVSLSILPGTKEGEFEVNSRRTVNEEEVYESKLVMCANCFQIRSLSLKILCPAKNETIATNQSIASSIEWPTVALLLCAALMFFNLIVISLLLFKISSKRRTRSMPLLADTVDE